jgi:hypothetical protein
MTKEIADWSVSQRTVGPSSAVHISSFACADAIQNEEDPSCVHSYAQRGNFAFQSKHRFRSSLGEPVKRRMVADVEGGEQEASGGQKTYVRLL